MSRNLGPRIAVSLAIFVAAGCGGGVHGNQKHGTGMSSTTSKIVRGGLVVPADRVPTALSREGRLIHYRKGPTPQGFVKAYFGTAETKRHVKTQFGILLAGKPGAERYYDKAMLRLVPGAKTGDATVGISYVVITTTNPNTPYGSRVEREEDFLQAGLDEAVAGLAPKALDIEGP